jgi:hypothetical protein
MAAKCLKLHGIARDDADFPDLHPFAMWFEGHFDTMRWYSNLI